MRTEHLGYLIEISCKSFINQAATTLHIYQQSLSTAIKSLESEFNAPLIHRSFIKELSLPMKGKS